MCANKSTIFFSYFLTVVQQIIVYVNLGTRCLKPSALLLDILVFNSGTSLGEILGKKQKYFSQFTFHKSANLKNNTNIHPYLRGPWMYYVGMLVMTSAEHRFIE